MPEIPDGAKQPQDHLSRVEPVGPFTFTVEGLTYSLPDATEAAQKKIPARVLRSAAMKDPLGELGIVFASLDVSGASPETLEALYSLPMDEMQDIYVQWTRHKTTVEAASLGESGDSPT